MLITWKGAGAVVIILPILVCLIVNIATSKAFDENNYFQGHLWPKLLALGITGLSCWFLGRYLHRRPPTIKFDHATGREIAVKPEHDFMFIKLEYWGVIFLLIGAGLLAFNLIAQLGK